MPETTGMLPSYARPAAMPTLTCSAQPHIEEAVGELVAELHERRADVGRDDPEVRVLFAEFGEGRSDDRPGTEESHRT